MVDQDAHTDELAALREGRAFVDLSERRLVQVTGADAIGWLHDLLTADVAGLAPGTSCRSLLLTPTGRIRADVQVLRRAGDVVLIQTREQPDDVGAALAPYILSSAVALDDLSDTTLIALPDAVAAPDGAAGFIPSSVGPGVDLLVPAHDHDGQVERLVADGRTAAGAEALEAWRIERAIPRFGLDLATGSLPAEVALEHLIDTTKGCFLGQESVARVRMLGHPPRALLHVRASSLRPAEPVFAEGEEVGIVTSATVIDGGAIGFVHVVWAARLARLTDADGHPFVVTPSAG